MTPRFTTEKNPNLIFDVGLHRGEDTDFYLKKGFRVVAFDANEELVQFCRERFSSYVASGQLTIVLGAIVESDSYQPGKMVHFYRNEGSAWGTIRPDWADRNERGGASSVKIEVNAIDFKEALRHYGVPRYLKIDIEGCDMICVRALADFKERPDFVSLESDKTSFSGVRAEIEQLASLGYDRFQAVEQTSVSDVPAAFPAREGQTVDHHFELGASGPFGNELPDQWMTKPEILRRYRIIRLGYYLVGDDGILNRMPTRAGSWLRRLARWTLKRMNGRNPVPGWYDTHARLGR